MYRIVFLVVLIFGFTNALAQTIADADKYFEENKYKEAIDAYTFLIKKETGYNKTLYMKRGLVCYAFSQYEDAIKDFDLVLSYNPKDQLAYYRRGATYYQLAQFEKAKADFESTIKYNPKFVEAYTALGLLYNEHYDKAIAYHSKAISIDPLFTLAIYNRALLYYEYGLDKKALEEMDRCIGIFTSSQAKEKNSETDPNYLNALILRASILEEQKQWDKALVDCQTILHHYEYHLEALELRAEIYIRQKKKDLACKDLQKAKKYGSMNIDKLIRKTCK